MDVHVHIHNEPSYRQSQASEEPEQLRDRLDSIMHRMSYDGYIPSEEEYSLLKRAGYLKY